jgi:hypothetical protein
LLNRSHAANLFVDGDQLRAQLLEPAELGDLALGLLKGYEAGEGLSHRLAVDLADKADLRSVAVVAGFCAMASWLPTAAANRTDGSRTKVT